MEFGERTGMAAKKGEGEEGKEKDEKQEEEEAMKEMMAETKSKKKIDSKMFKNILSMKQEELSTAAAEYQEMRERAARWRFLYFSENLNPGQLLPLFSGRRRRTQWQP